MIITTPSGGSGGSGTVTNTGGALTNNAVVIGAGGNDTKVNAVHTDNGTTLTYSGTGGIVATTSGGLNAGANGGAAGILTLNGSTSGNETLQVNSTGTSITASASLAATGNIGVTAGNSGGFNLTSSNGAATGGFQHIQESITLNTGGTTTDSAGNLLPANSLILAVTWRITTTITTAASFTIGDATTAARLVATQSTLTAGTTGVGMQQFQGSVTTDAAGPVQAAAAKVRITTNVNPGAGVMHVDVFFISFGPPSS